MCSSDLEDLPKEARTLSAYLDSLWALHNMLQILTAYATMMPRPLIMTKDRLVGADLVQAELGKIKLAVDNLKDKSVATTVAGFLNDAQNVVLSKYILSLQGTVYKLLSEDGGEAGRQQVQVVRAAIAEVTRWLFPPPASFPMAMPQSAAAQAVYRASPPKGPLLHVAVPQPYVDLGQMMLSLDEGARNQVKAEWSRLDVLLADALQAKGISSANNAALAMQASHQMLHTSRELDQMRGRLCELHSGIGQPRSQAEYKEWIKVYEKQVVARMIKAKEKADRDFSEHQAAALSSGDAAHQGSAQSRVAEKAQADYQALQSEMAQRAYMVKMMHDLCCKHFLQRETDRALRAHAAAMQAVDVLAIDTPDDSKHKGLHKTAISQKAGARRKEELLLEFLQEIRVGAREDTDSNTGVAVLVIPKFRLAEALDLLAGKLRDWGEVRMEEAVKGLRLQVANLTHLLYLQERDMVYKEAVREREQQSMARRIDVAVKDQCFALLFRMDDLQRKLEASQSAMAEMERTVRQRLKVEFEELVKDLEPTTPQIGRASCRERV